MTEESFEGPAVNSKLLLARIGFVIAVWMVASTIFGTLRYFLQQGDATLLNNILFISALIIVVGAFAAVVGGLFLLTFHLWDRVTEKFEN